MIISASRRTDIPAFYTGWFFNRLNEGFVITKNPMNPNQTKRVSLLPDDVDSFVFWTKNPKPMLARLPELSRRHYYFQFTLTSYANDVEVNLPKKSDIIDTFKRLSESIGAERIIWRYDPIFINGRYTIDYHVQYFGEIASRLNGFTNTVIISFIDLYSKFSKRFPVRNVETSEILTLAKELSAIAKGNHMAIKTCAEETDLSAFGIGHASCVDGKLIEKLTGKTVDSKRDKNQRPACGCVPSVDIGAYNTCNNGCLYCYANYSETSIKSNMRKHDPSSPQMLG